MMMLKTAVILCIVGYSLGQVSPPVSPPHDGQPGCQIRYEFRRLWRNNFDNSVYWQCDSWRVPATLRHCPSGTNFQDSWQVCVPFNQWEWTPYSEPPTRPGCEAVEECDEIVIEVPETPDCPWVCPTDPPITDTTPTVTPPVTPTPTPTPDGETTTTPDSETTPDGGIDVEPSGICPGATDEQHDPGTMSCFPPECTIGEWVEGTLYPTRDPTKFYQCGPGTGNLYVMPCAPGTCFSFSHQVCIHVRDWRNDCA